MSNKSIRYIKANYMTNKDFINLVDKSNILGIYAWIPVLFIISGFFVFNIESAAYMMIVGLVGFICFLMLKTHFIHFPVVLNYDDLGSNPEKIYELKVSVAHKIALSFFSMMKSCWAFLLVLGAVKMFLVDIYFIPSESMMPTLNVANVVVVNKTDKMPNNGDVVVFNHGNVAFIKRVIAKGGDVIVIDNNKVTVNGQEEKQTLVKESKLEIGKDTYKWNIYDTDKHQIGLSSDVSNKFPSSRFSDLKENCQYAENYLKCTVPQNSYFVMGDNRQFSDDSRYWGFLKQEDVLGIAEYKNFKDKL